MIFLRFELGRMLLSMKVKEVKLEAYLSM